MEREASGQSESEINKRLDTVLGHVEEISQAQFEAMIARLLDESTDIRTMGVMTKIDLCHEGVLTVLPTESPRYNYVLSYMTPHCYPLQALIKVIG